MQAAGWVGDEFVSGVGHGGRARRGGEQLPRLSASRGLYYWHLALALRSWQSVAARPATSWHSSHSRASPQFFLVPGRKLLGTVVRPFLSLARNEITCWQLDGISVHWDEGVWEKKNSTSCPSLPASHLIASLHLLQPRRNTTQQPPVN